MYVRDSPVTVEDVAAAHAEALLDRLPLSVRRKCLARPVIRDYFARLLEAELDAVVEHLVQQRMIARDRAAGSRAGRRSGTSARAWR